MNCKCKKCGYQWSTKGDKKPKSCPGCKSYTWDRKKKVQVVTQDVESAVEMSCAVCNKVLEEGETIYRAQEGKNVNGVFVFEDPKMQGLYCMDCMVEEDVLPFAEDKS